MRRGKDDEEYEKDDEESGGGDGGRRIGINIMIRKRRMMMI